VPFCFLTIAPQPLDSLPDVFAIISSVCADTSRTS
jgi:hypothetical protein